MYTYYTHTYYIIRTRTIGRDSTPRPASQGKLFHNGEFRVSSEFRTGENPPFHETCRSLFAFYGWQMALSIICERLIVCLYIGVKKNAN